MKKYEKKLKESRGTFVKDVVTEQTGGGIMNDIITLNDRSVIIVIDDAIYFYKNERGYRNQDSPDGSIYRY